METFLIVVLALVALGFRTYMTIKKQDDFFGNPEDSATRRERSAAKAKARPKKEAKAATFEDEEREAGYFSYETLDETASAPAATERRKARQAVSTAAYEEQEEEPMQFDMRQAVIYQTILENPYNTVGAIQRN